MGVFLFLEILEIGFVQFDLGDTSSEILEGLFKGGPISMVWGLQLFHPSGVFIRKGLQRPRLSPRGGRKAVPHETGQGGYKYDFFFHGLM
jgi:hypothetical protein